MNALLLFASEAHEPNSLVLPSDINEVIWGTIGFLVVFTLIVSKGGPAIKNMWNARIARIRSEIETAEAARSEAEAKLAKIDSDIANAVSLNSANFNAGRLVGPALSGFLIARFDTGPSFLINAGTYIFVILALLRMRESEFFIQEKKITQGTVREGLDYALARPDLYVVMLVVFFVATFGLNMQIFNALMATKEFGRASILWITRNIYRTWFTLWRALFGALGKTSPHDICD